MSQEVSASATETDLSEQPNVGLTPRVFDGSPVLYLYLLLVSLLNRGKTSGICLARRGSLLLLAGAGDEVRCPVLSPCTTLRNGGSKLPSQAGALR